MKYWNGGAWTAASGGRHIMIDQADTSRGMRYDIAGNLTNDTYTDQNESQTAVLTYLLILIRVIRVNLWLT